MILLVVLAVLPEMIALFDTGLEVQVYFFGGERYSIWNITPSRHSLEVTLVFDSSCLEPEKGPVDLCAAYPQRCFGIEFNLT